MIFVWGNITEMKQFLLQYLISIYGLKCWLLENLKPVSVNLFIRGGGWVGVGVCLSWGPGSGFKSKLCKGEYKKMKSVVYNGE